MIVATATVVPPAKVTARTRCTGTTVSVTLNWTASTSAGVSGYRIRVRPGHAYRNQGTVGATTTWQGNADTYDVANDVMTFSVWARIVC